MLITVIRSAVLVLTCPTCGRRK